jgi:outer membrane protein OmpA-like peptidoglycan-associated protein
MLLIGHYFRGKESPMKVRFFEKVRVHAWFLTILIFPFLALSIQSNNQVAAGNDSALAASSNEAVVVCEAVLFSASDFARVRNDAEHKKCFEDIAIKLEEFKLKDPPEVPFFVIDGHRDSTETRGISLTRANNFRDFLVGELQVEGSHIKVRHFGDTCPLATPSSTTSTGEMNRRIQIWIVAKDKEAPKDRAGMKCRSGSTPREITDEQPAPSKDSLPN